MEQFNPNNLIIRPVQANDASSIRLVSDITWLATYPSDDRGISRNDIQQFLDKQEADKQAASIAQYVEDNGKSQIYLVAEYDNQIIGFCRVKFGTEEDELKMFYILPEFQGKGIGRKLFNEIERKRNSRKDMILFVVEYNEQVIKFYEKIGFKKDNEVRLFEIGGGKSLPDMKMRKTYE